MVIEPWPLVSVCKWAMPSSSGVGVHSAINSANALLWIVDVLSNFKPKTGQLQSPFPYSAGSLGVLEYTLQRETSDNRDLMGLEVVV